MEDLPVSAASTAEGQQGVSLMARIAERVRQGPDKVAIIEKNGVESASLESDYRHISYGQLWQSIICIAEGLQQRGMVKGDHIGLWLDNSAAYVAAYYASWYLGLVAIPLNTQLKLNQLAGIASHSEIKLLVADEKTRTQLIEADGLTQTLPCRFFVDEALLLQSNFPSLPTPLIEKREASTDLASIIYTSGSTGQSKGVMLSERNFAANVQAIVEYLELRAADRVLCPLPFYYSYGNSVLHTHLSVGASIVIENNFLYPHLILERMERFQVTGFSGVPSTFSLLLNRCDLSQYSLDHLRYLTQAGGAMSGALIEKMRRALPRAKLFVMYGQTEATARLTYLPPKDLGELGHTVGVPIPGVEISIRDESGAVLPANKTGEICARGDNVMLGYWRDPAETAVRFFGDWLRTGDLGSLDERGYLTIHGRNSSLIKSGAHRISAEEIEQVIADIEGVDAVGVCAISDDLLGEAIKACVLPKAGANLSRAQVLQHCSRLLPKYKLPKHVVFVDQLPLTASGKLQRHLLVNWGESS